MDATPRIWRQTDRAGKAVWAEVELLDHSRVWGLVSVEEHYGMRLYRVERPTDDGSSQVEYYGFISVSCVIEDDRHAAERKRHHGAAGAGAAPRAPHRRQA